MMDKLNGCFFLIEDCDLLDKDNTIWDSLLHGDEVTDF